MFSATDRLSLIKDKDCELIISFNKTEVSGDFEKSI